MQKQNGYLVNANSPINGHDKTKQRRTMLDVALCDILSWPALFPISSLQKKKRNFDLQHALVNNSQFQRKR